MKRDNNKKKKLDDFKRQLSNIPPEEFDGHVDFSKLTVEQKLIWLSQASEFVEKYRGALNKKKNKVA